MSGLCVLGRRSVVLGAKWSGAASIDDVLASKDSLRRGDQGDAVSHVQRFLGIDEDGKYGPDTESAVAAFQDAHVTEPHERGVVNAATYRALAALGPGSAAPAQGRPSGPPSSGRSSPPPSSGGDQHREAPPDTASAPVWKKAAFAALAGGVAVGGAILVRRILR